MGLISRVSSRTYRFSTMMRLARVLRQGLYPANTAVPHAGLHPLNAPRRPSATIITLRWLALGCGILYGSKRWYAIQAIRPAERKREKAAADAILSAEAALAAKANEEFMKDSILFEKPAAE